MFSNFKGETKNGKLKIECWSEKNILKPNQVSLKSNKKYFFNCDECNHEFLISLSKIFYYNTWCSYCSSTNLCKNTDCNHCYLKSFASFKGKTKKEKLIIDCWSDKNILKPRDIFKSTNDKYYFDCDVCNHEIFKSIWQITDKRCRWCPYCSIFGKKLCDNDNCDFCLNRSLAGFKEKTPKGNLKLDCWDKSNDKNPRQIFRATDTKYNFKCDICANIFSISISGLTKKNILSWCPHCKNKTETKFNYYFKNKYPQYNIIQQPKYEWCKNKKCLPFDFVIEELKIIIEIDGEQHFSKKSNWYEPEINLKNDTFKTIKAIENNYTVIRILQEDIWLNNNDWENKLNKLLINYKTPMIFFINKNNKYKNHLDNLTNYYKTNIFYL